MPMMPILAQSPSTFFDVLDVLDVFGIYLETPDALNRDFLRTLGLGVKKGTHITDPLQRAANTTRLKCLG